MSGPDGSLTPAQFEILQMLWDAPDGLPAVEIWERICEDRAVSRTTVMNLLDRLEKRRWLQREKLDGVFRYRAAVERDATQGLLASKFLGEFFDGSTTNFVLSLLGSKRISKGEFQRLKFLLDDLKQTKPNKKG